MGLPKTKESNRTITLPQAVVKPLAEYLLAHPPVRGASSSIATVIR